MRNEYSRPTTSKKKKKGTISSRGGQQVERKIKLFYILIVTNITANL